LFKSRESAKKSSERHFTPFFNLFNLNFLSSEMALKALSSQFLRGNKGEVKICQTKRYMQY